MLYDAVELTRVFRGRKVLNLKHFTIEKGKIYALTGANGAGKTTLLNLLAFLDKPTTGQLHFCGLAVQYSRQHLLDLRRRIVLVDQHPILFTEPVWKNVEFGLKVRGISKKLRRKRTEEVLELVGMEKFLLADAHKLSGGESKRIALARALAIEPEVLLCDEPTANVDAENQKTILKILKRINTEKQTSILLATHYLSQSRHLAHHTLVLEHGALSDTMNENIYRCQSINRAEDSFICQLSNQVHLRLPYTKFQGIKKPCKIYLDPEKIRILSQPEEVAKQENSLTGHVVRIEEDTGRVRLTMDCGIKLHALLTMEEYLHHLPMIGEKRTVCLPEKSILFSHLKPFG